VSATRPQDSPSESKAENRQLSTAFNRLVGAYQAPPIGLARETRQTPPRLPEGMLAHSGDNPLWAAALAINVRIRLVIVDGTFACARSLHGQRIDLRSAGVKRAWERPFRRVACPVLSLRQGWA
jgi:hypothetical protein